MAERMTNTCPCGRPTKDAAYVCEDASTILVNDLNECPGLDEELEVTITRQRGAAIEGGSANSGETALPWHDKASEIQRELHNALSTWVRSATKSTYGTRQPDDNLPSDTIDRHV
jgi:hypothetical protein